MRKLLLLISIIAIYLIGSTVFFPADRNIEKAAKFDSNDPKITYVGRWAILTKDGNKTKAAISGDSHFRLKFTGTKITLHFANVKNTPFVPEILWSVNNGSYNRTEVKNKITLASGLDQGEHTLEVWVGGLYPWEGNRWHNHQVVMFQGITLDHEASLVPWPTGAKGKMLVIGDSIVEGNVLYGLPHSPLDFPGRPNFGNQVAALLGMENWQQAFAGSGFYGANNIGIPPTHNNYQYIMDEIPHNDPDFDIVLIAAGHNDGEDNIDSITFKSRYKTLIDRIRADSPKAEIFLMRPLNPWVPERYADVKAVAEEKDCHYIDTADWLVSAPSTTYNHPDLEGHTAIANYLKPILEPYVPK